MHFLVHFSQKLKRYALAPIRPDSAKKCISTLFWPSKVHSECILFNLFRHLCTCYALPFFVITSFLCTLFLYI